LYYDFVLNSVDGMSTCTYFFFNIYLFTFVSYEAEMKPVRITLCNRVWLCGMKQLQLYAFHHVLAGHVVQNVTQMCCQVFIVFQTTHFPWVN